MQHLWGNLGLQLGAGLTAPDAVTRVCEVTVGQDLTAYG